MTDKPLPEDDPKAWERFERAVDAALHTPPKHRKAKGSGESSPAKRAGAPGEKAPIRR